MRVKLCQICDYAQVDGSGKTSLIGIFDRIHTTDLPAVLPPFSIFFSASTDPGDGIVPGEEIGVVIEILAIGTEETAAVFRIEGKGNAQPSPGVKPEGEFKSSELRMLIQCQGVAVNSTGDYEARISFNGNVVYGVPFSVELVERRS